MFGIGTKLVLESGTGTTWMVPVPFCFYISGTSTTSFGTGKDENIGFHGYIDNWILRIYRIYRRYIGGYFYMNIDISKINKNTLKLMETLYKSVKMTLIMKYKH